jgi:serine/threonine protein kinase
MKYPTRKTHKNKHRKQYRGGVLPSTSTSTSNNNNQRKSKRFKINNDLKTQYVDFESKENAVQFRQGLRNTEPPHTMMFNNNIEPIFIGKGVYGCAYKPPIKCSTPCNDDRCRDHIPRISKFMDKTNADKEMAIYSDLNLNEDELSKYFITNPYQCTPDENFKIDEIKCPVKIDLEKSAASLLIYENGGIDLNQYLKNNNYMRGKEKDADFLSILKGLLNIFEGVRVLNEHRIFHFDIKEDNIVLGKENKDYKLIDFGNAKRMPFFCNTVKLDHIERQTIHNNSNMNTNLATEAFTPSRASANATPSRSSASATPSKASANTTPSKASANTTPSKASANATPSKSKPDKMVITVQPPQVIFRILPVYQFFITQPFKDNQPPREDYDLLANKFIERFIIINDNIINLIRYYYKLTGFFTEDIEKNKIALKSIFNTLYDMPPDARLSLINKTLDMYSIGLVILKITIYKYIELFASELSDPEMRNLPTIQFITDNKLLHPDPTKHLSIDEIIENYKKFIRT